VVGACAFVSTGSARDLALKSFVTSAYALRARVDERPQNDKFIYFYEMILRDGRRERTPFGCTTVNGYGNCG